MEPILKPTIALGSFRQGEKEYWSVLHWADTNGMIVAGQSGSGKSQTVSWLLNQYAYWGVKIIVCDYNSPQGEEETLIERIKHLEGAYWLPPARDIDSILSHLDALHMEYLLRLEDPTRRYPLLLVLDEMSAFLFAMKRKKDNQTIANLTQGLLVYRKLGIRVILVGQEWSTKAVTPEFRTIRSSFRTVLIHTLDPSNLDLLISSPSTSLTQTIRTLPVGKILVGDTILSVPLLSNDEKLRAVEKIQQYNNHTPIDDDNLITELLQTSDGAYNAGYKSAGFDPMNTVELLKFWHRRGHTKHDILKYLVRGNIKTLTELYTTHIEG
jgi:hypothetical protein